MPHGELISKGHAKRQTCFKPSYSQASLPKFDMRLENDPCRGNVVQAGFTVLSNVDNHNSYSDSMKGRYVTPWRQDISSMCRGWTQR